MQKLKIILNKKVENKTSQIYKDKAWKESHKKQKNCVELQQ